MKVFSKKISMDNKAVEVAYRTDKSAVRLISEGSNKESYVALTNSITNEREFDIWIEAYLSGYYRKAVEFSADSEDAVVRSSSFDNISSDEKSLEDMDPQEIATYWINRLSTLRISENYGIVKLLISNGKVDLNFSLVDSVPDRYKEGEIYVRVRVEGLRVCMEAWAWYDYLETEFANYGAMAVRFSDLKTFHYLLASLHIELANSMELLTGSKVHYNHFRFGIVDSSKVRINRLSTRF